MHRFDTSNVKRFCQLLIKIDEVVKVKLVELLDPVAVNVRRLKLHEWRGANATPADRRRS